MKCIIKWSNIFNMTLLATTSSGHSIVMDSNPKTGGQNLAPRPMEMLLLGAGGCTTYDIILILKKNQQDIKECKIKLTSKRSKKDPKIFTKINFKFNLYGNNLKENIVKNAIQLSHNKYCSASIMLSKTAKITYSYKIINYNFK